MTGDQLKYVKQKIGYGTYDMYHELKLPRRTYQDYEAGKRAVPPTVARQVLQLYRADRRWTRGMGERIDEALKGQAVPNEAEGWE